LIDQLAETGGEWSVVALMEVEGNRLAVEIAREDEQAQLVLEVTDDDPPELSLLGIQPSLGDPAEFGDWDEAEEALTGLGDEVVFLAAIIDDDGSCQPIASHESDQRGPLGSTFKRYVLGALIDAVGEGRIGWEDELEITEQLTSLPSGVLQEEDPGTTVTVAEAAELMIEVSDNTGTDLLIDVLGRGAVEKAQANCGHTDPSVNRPFITTRELFQLSASTEAADTFVASDEDGRRQLLAELSDQPLPELTDLELEPSLPQQPEWYASPAELCDALVAIDEAATGRDMQPARDAFGAEPPPRIDEEWELVGAKAGGQPGVYARAWLLGRDDTRFAFTISVDHSDHIDPAQLIPALEGAVNLMADDLS
jgi:beta-lactamase class A